MDVATAADSALETLRTDVINIVLGTVFLTVAATACTIAAIRGRRSVRFLVRQKPHFLECKLQG